MDYEIIAIGKKKLPIKFGFNALRIYSELTGITLSQLGNIGSDMSLNEAITLMWCGLKDGHRAAKQDFEMTIDEASDLIDGNFDCLEKVFEVLAKQMSSGFEKKNQAKKTKAKS